MVEIQLNEEQFQVNQFQENQLQERQLNEVQLQVNQFQETQLNEEKLQANQFQENQLQERQLNEVQLQVNQFQETQLNEEKLQANQFQENQLQERQLNEVQLQVNQFQETQLNEEKLQANQFQENQLQERQLNEVQLQVNQFQETQLNEEKLQANQFQDNQLQEKQPQEKQPQENSHTEKTHAQILKEIVLKEALSKGKQVIEKNGNGPRKVVFETNLRRAVELVEILRIEEGYVRSHLFKKNKPKTKKFVQTKACNSSESPCNPDPKHEEPAPKRRKGNSPGSAIYECHCHLPCQEEVRVKNQAKGKTYERVRDTIGSGCRAKITIRYEEGYFQEVKGEINVARFGDSKVTVTWVYDHNHKVILLREFARISARTSAPISEAQPQVRT